MWDKTPPIPSLEMSLSDTANPIGMRMRAAYFLRQIHANSNSNIDISDSESKSEAKQKTADNIRELVVQILSRGLVDSGHGSLMRHELAYVMGQLRDERCCDTLEKVLGDSTDCVMVRHEAAEALGAIGASRSKHVLQEVMEQSANENVPELSETCQIALDVMNWRDGGGDPNELPAACACMLNPYSSVDPAPPHPSHADKDFEFLGDVLCDASRPIFERYRAMFSLRNRGGDEAVKQLCRALVEDTSSALLRHEVAYVLGQMQHPASVESLEESLRRTGEHRMVRHESAEALGAIDGRWDDVEKILQEFSKDEDDVVRESCLVALDAADYWGYNSPESTLDLEEEKQITQMPFSHQKNDPRLLKNHFNVRD